MGKKARIRRAYKQAAYEETKKFPVSEEARQAIAEEIASQMMEAEAELMKNIDAIVMAELNLDFGFGAERLRRFYKGTIKLSRALRERYSLKPSENCAFEARRYLKEKVGIDLDEWDRTNWSEEIDRDEKEKKNSGNK